MKSVSIMNRKGVCVGGGAGGEFNPFMWTE